MVTHGLVVHTDDCASDPCLSERYEGVSFFLPAHEVRVESACNHVSGDLCCSKMAFGEDVDSGLDSE